MKNSVKALDVKCPAFMGLCGKFLRLTYEKIKAGVFIGPQIRKHFKGQQFEAVLSDRRKQHDSPLKRFKWFSGKFQSCKFQRTCTRSDGFV